MIEIIKMLKEAYRLINILSISFLAKEAFSNKLTEIMKGLAIKLIEV